MGGGDLTVGVEQHLPPLTEPLPQGVHRRRGRRVLLLELRHGRHAAAARTPPATSRWLREGGSTGIRAWRRGTQWPRLELSGAREEEEDTTTAAAARNGRRNGVEEERGGGRVVGGRVALGLGGGKRRRCPTRLFLCG